MNQVLLIMMKERGYSAANGYQLCITQILNIQDSLEKENKKMELQQIINDKEILLTVITLENYFITWSIVFTISANKVVVQL
jgi:hypothetical protein